MPNNKPYTHDRDVTYEMVTTHPYFRTLAEHELYHVLNWMDERGYKKLPGSGTQEKLRLLQESWKAPVYNSYAVYAATTEEARELSHYQNKLFSSCESVNTGFYYRFSLVPGEKYSCGSSQNRWIYALGGNLAVDHIFDSFQDWKAYIARVEGKEAPARKVVGYKLPVSIYNDNIPAGTIYRICDAAYVAVPLTNRKGDMSNSLPSEIVETWEAVYEEVKTVLEIGTPKKTVTITPGKIEVEGRTVLFNKLADLYHEMTNPPNLAEWRVTYEQVKIGCSRFTAQEIFQVLTAYTNITK